MFLSIRNYLRGPYTLYGPTILTKDEPVPLDNKWLPGDTIHPESGIVQIRKPTHVVGIVDYISRTGQGFSSRGIPLYMFYPLSESYPPMIVSSKEKHQENKIVIATFEHWESKWPRAGIQRVLGSVGDMAVEKSALLLRSAITSKVVENEHVGSTENHNPAQWDTVFNIDPDGCVDVDDVICWRRVGDDYEFGIAIADVSSCIQEGSELDQAASLSAQTLYVDGKASAPMLPRNISEYACSLRNDGIQRPALALIYTIRDNHIIGIRWERILISCQKTYTYDNVYENRELCEKLSRFLTVIAGPAGEDSHHWIELAMIAYNREAARVLREKRVGILREHAGTTRQEWLALAEQTGCADLAWFGYASGKYVAADASDVRHAGLDVDCYCHASSPLRRYADLVNQRWLKHILFQEPAPSRPVYPTYLNERGRVAKQLDRDIWFLSNLHSDRITTCEGILLSDTPDGRWKVYVPSWKRKITGKFADVCPIDAQIGARVEVRAYTNLKSAKYDQRLVCSLLPIT